MFLCTSFISASSSILSGSTASSLPAQKYFNSKKTPVLPGEGNPSRPGPPGVKLKHSFDPLRNLPLNPEDDILYQWRLRRRLELAREEAEAVGEEGRRFRRGRGSGWSRGLLHRGLEEQYSEGDGRGCDGVRESVRLQMAAEEENYHDCVRSQTVRLQECGHVVPSSEPKRVEVHRVVPPVRHHAHLQRCCQATVPPHVHTSCDVIPCPCCSTGSGHREESERAAVGEGAETRPIRQRRAGGKEGERRSGGGGSRRGGAPRGRDQLRDRRTGQEGEETAKSSEALHFEPHHTLKITGHGSYESQSSGMPGSMTAATLQPQPPDKESTYRSAPVRYPSPSVLTRHRSRTQHHARTARAARDDQQDYPGLKQPPPTTTSTVSTQSDPEAESLPGDSLHLSLSFSSEADQTLTPGRQATSCQGDGARETSASTGADPSITSVISKVRKPACMMSMCRAIFVSRCHLSDHLPQHNDCKDPKKQFTSTLKNQISFHNIHASNAVFSVTHIPAYLTNYQVARLQSNFPCTHRWLDSACLTPHLRAQPPAPPTAPPT